jgi:hypothetical protein
MKVCAYCNENKKLTREHIWPSTILRKYEDGLKTYNPRTESYFTGDALIKDVCSECNSGKLSAIDSYLSKEYDKAFGTIVQPGESVLFRYDYELLLRSLLKISYNSARAHNALDSKTVKLHREFIPFILDGGYKPKIMLRIQIVTAAHSVDLSTGDKELIQPNLLRCAEIRALGISNSKFIVRMLAINSYWFYFIVAYKRQPQHIWDKHLHKFQSANHLNGLLVNSEEQSLSIPVEKTTWLDPKLLGNLATAR